MAQSFTYNDINNLYNKNLGRSASQDEYQGWASGQFGSDPNSQIAGSGEAQDYAKNQGGNVKTQPVGAGVLQSKGNVWGSPGSSTGGAGIPGGVPQTGGSVRDWLGSFAGKQGINESVGRDPGYWERRIGETGGLNEGNKAYWEGLMRRPEGAPEGGSMQGGQWVSSGGGGNYGGGGSSFSSSTHNDPRSNQIFDLLMKRANQSLVQDPNDPIIRNQTDAYNAQNTRESRNYLAGVAERGGPNANVNAETRAASEKVGQLGGQFQAQLMQRELDARRQEIQSALSGAAGFLTQEQQMQLQEEMAALDRAQNESQFGRNLGQRAYEYDTTDQFRNSPLGS